MADFKASLAVGFEARPDTGLGQDIDDANYFLLTEAQKTAFKDAFGTEVLAALNDWFTSEGKAGAMGDWPDYVLSLASPDGAQPETDVVDHINSRLNPPVASATPEFAVGDPDVAATFRGVRYFYYEGQRVCLHSHLLLRRDGGGNLAEWRVPAEAEPNYQQAVEITLAWTSPPLMA